ncbi:MAG: Hpt domain-containing protein [Moraxellaceae bacterium]|nr:MAG: Hpt domain-containing protein [Moraxellaceae bacterium]
MVDEVSLNTEMLEELRELLADSFNELIDRYLSDSQARFNLLQQAIAEQDFKVIYYEAHGIKGSSRNMGANRLAELMGQLEASGHAQNALNLHEVFTEAQLEYARVVTGLASARNA